MMDLKKIPLAEILDMIGNIDKKIEELKDYEDVLIEEIERRFPGFNEKLQEEEEESKILGRHK